MTCYCFPKVLETYIDKGLGVEQRERFEKPKVKVKMLKIRDIITGSGGDEVFFKQ